MRTARNLSLTAAIGLTAILGSCSDPVPPAAQGSGSIVLGPPSAQGSTCGAPHTVNVPFDANKRGATTNASSSQGKAIDGENGATVSCSVAQNGSSYVVTGALQSNANAGMIQISVVIAPGQSNANGALTVGDVDTVPPLVVDQNRPTSVCTFSVVPAAGEQLGIAPGRIWTRVTCTDLGVPNEPNTACNVSNSYVILENCDQ